MAMKFTRDALNKRFHAAGVEREALMEKMKPIHAEHKALAKQVQELELRMKPLAEALRPFRDQLADLENERAMIARAARDADGKSRHGKLEDYLTPDEVAAIRQAAGLPG